MNVVLVWGTGWLLVGVLTVATLLYLSTTAFRTSGGHLDEEACLIHMLLGPLATILVVSAGLFQWAHAASERRVQREKERATLRAQRERELARAQQEVNQFLEGM